MMQKKWGMIKMANMALDCFLVWCCMMLVGQGNAAFVPKWYMVAYPPFQVLIYYVIHLYEIPRAAKTNFSRIGIGSALGILGMMALLYAQRIVHVATLSLLLLGILNALLVALRHVLSRWAIAVLNKKGRFQKHYLLVGSGRLARQYIQDLQNQLYPSNVIDGYVGDTEIPGFDKRFGRYGDLERITAGGRYDGLIVALDADEIHLMPRVIETAGKEGLSLYMIPFFNDYFPAHPTMEHVGKTTLLNLRATPLDLARNMLVKRMVDIVGSVALIILTSPIMLLVAIGVKRSGEGPILFCQKRVGKNQKPFVMHKFRSMSTQIDHEGWTVKNDPRRTQFGKFIRKYFLDELPQLFDVLAGHMSLVGPRPEIPRYVRQFKEDVPFYLVRQQVKPGMTGWAQVHGLRGDTSIEKRVQYDIWYIENWSLSLDFQILFKTVFGCLQSEE